MRHITDGELHAFLDGALDILPHGRGEEVREHLLVCPVCRERLQDEEAILARSQQILGSPALGDLPLPSFEELRERAEAGSEGGRVLNGGRKARPRQRGPLAGTPLAWAATVVLALGVGWMGGELWRAGPAVDRVVSAGAQDRVARDSEDGMEPIEILEAELPPEVRLAEYEPAGAASQESRAKAGAEAPPPSPSRSVELPGVRLASERTEMAAPALQEPPALLRVDQDPSVGAAGLSVPGLRVLSVDWEESAPGERALYIRQLLSPGDTLELRYLGMLMGTEPNRERSLDAGAQAAEKAPEHPLSPAVLEASLPPGWNQVEMRWGRGWLVARAPLPESSIRALIHTLR